MRSAMLSDRSPAKPLARNSAKNAASRAVLCAVLDRSGIIRTRFLNLSRPSFSAQIHWRQPAEDDHQYGSEQQEAGDRQQRNGETLHNILDLTDHEDRHDHATASGRGHAGPE